LPNGFRVYDSAYPHFITCSIVYWIPVFRREDYFLLLADSLRYCIERKGLRVHGYVIMPDHFHALSSVESGLLPDVVRDLKKHTSKAIAGKLEEEGRTLWLNAMRRAAGASGGVSVWNPDYHPEQVHTRAFFEQKLRYMHENPVRAGFVNDPSEWRYSSAAAYYRDGESLVPITGIEW